MSRWQKSPKIGEILGDPSCCNGLPMTQTTPGVHVCVNCGCNVGTDRNGRIDSIGACDTHEHLLS